MIDFDNMESAADYWIPITDWMDSRQSILGIQTLAVREGLHVLIEQCTMDRKTCYRICTGKVFNG